MSSLYKKLCFVLAFLILSVWCVYPPAKKLRLGKDLRGGVSLIYSVQLRSGDNPSNIIGRVIEALKQRVDPTGLMEISIVQQGQDRIEVQMPLPNDEVKKARAAFDAELGKLNNTELTPDRVDRVMRLAGEERTKRLGDLAGGSGQRMELARKAASAYDAMVARRGEVGDGSDVAKLAAAADAARDYDDARYALIRSSLSAEDVRQVVALSDVPRKVTDNSTGELVTLPSARQSALGRLKADHPDSAGEIDSLVQTYKAYEAKRTTLDDPQDLIRMLRGSGELSFRITVDPGTLGAEETRLRAELHEVGPGNVKATDYHWYKLNQIENWLNSKQDVEYLQNDANAAAFFQARGYIAEPYRGEYYMLCWDTRSTRLTRAEGRWQVASASPATDRFGRQSINFQMDPAGAQLLGQLTGQNVQKHMAVLLDDQVYTAPTLQSQISSSGEITGDFSKPEIDYIVRVLGGGALAARISKDPISTSVLGPSLGADNLDASFRTGVVAFLLVAGFMIVYYFTSGVIAVITLVYNCLLVVGLLALNRTAFTLPGIAGIILTFGQAVDSNVLIYERMREELQHGHDLKTSVRLGFSRALAPIVDGNVSNLIICIVLGFFGTEEIKAFAITLGVGVVTTLFSTLVFTRFLFQVMLEKFGWRKTSQLPMSVPAVQRALSPHVNWMGHRWTHLTILVVFLAASGAIAFHQGSDLLGMEFRGGTAVTLVFKQTPGPEGAPVQTKMTRAEVEKRVKDVAASAPKDSDLKKLENALVVAVNPDSDAVTSGTFTIRSLITDPKLVEESLVRAFQDKLDVRASLRFASSGSRPDAAPVYPMLDQSVDNAIHGAAVGAGNAPEFQGGAAIVLANITPHVTKDELDARLAAARGRHEFNDVVGHTWETRVIGGSNAEVSSAVLLVHDPDVGAEDRERWDRDVRDREWELVNAALTQSQTVAGVQSFSPSIAKTFATQAVVCTVLSLLLLTVYVFARFGTVRWALAATVPLFADVIGIIGLIGLAQILYESPATQRIAHLVGLRPFEVDLSQIAAVLTIVGYSLNDKIIILDRIRENKGKLKYASAHVINDSINQTLSRTVITAGAHMITTIALYIYGGEALRGFAFTFNLGVLLGTYTSIVSTPLVWSREAEAEESARLQAQAVTA